MKKKHFLFIVFLIFAVVVVWTVNFVLLRNIHTGKDMSDPEEISHVSSSESLTVETFTFTPLKRDPFNVVVDTVPQIPMPRCVLRGVVLTGDGAVALMELSDSKIYPMKKGDVYKGVKIKTISQDQVILQFRGRTDTLLVLP